MNGQRWVVLVLALVFLGPPLAVFGQTATGAYLSGQIGLGIATNDLIDGSAIGLGLGYRTPGGVVLAMDYLFAGTDHYYWDGSSWEEAARWSDVPDNGVGRGDWIFYRRRHALGLSGGLSGSAGPIGLFATGGLLINFIELSDASESYPEFREAAQQSSGGTRTAIASPFLRGGIIVPSNGSIVGMIALMVNGDRQVEADTVSYVQRNTLLLLGVNVQVGGL